MRVTVWFARTRLRPRACTSFGPRTREFRDRQKSTRKSEDNRGPRGAGRCSRRDSSRTLPPRTSSLPIILEDTPRRSVQTRPSRAGSASECGVVWRVWGSSVGSAVTGNDRTKTWETRGDAPGSSSETVAREVLSSRDGAAAKRTRTLDARTTAPVAATGFSFALVPLLLVS